MERSSSDKRKQTHTETFCLRTRSALPRTRSGLRRDPNVKRSKRTHHDTQPQSPSPSPSNSKTPKDLRTRRVFSPPSVDGVNLEIQPNGDISQNDEKEGGKIEILIQNPSGVDGVGELGQMVSPDEIEKPSPDVVDDESKKVELDVGVCQKDEKTNGVDEFEIDKISPDGVCEMIQSIPTPDSGAIDTVCLVKNNPSEEIAKEISPNSTVRLDVMVPCSRMKLFKNPSSFGYRRMLPYIRDLGKENNSNTLEDPLCQKNEKSVEENFVHSLSIIQDAPNDKCDCSTLEHPLVGSDDSSTQESREENLVDGLSNVKHSNLESTGHLPITPEIQMSAETTVLSTDGLAGHPLVEPASQKLTEASVLSIKGVDVDQTKIGQHNVCIAQEDQQKRRNNVIKSSPCDEGAEWLQTMPPDSTADRLHVLSSSSKERLSNEKEKNLKFKGLLRTKLFKNPSSFSYRRLQPFLKDLTKDYSHAVEIPPCRKAENSVEGKPLSLSVVQEIPKDGSNDKILSMRHAFGESHASPTKESREPILSNGSFNDSSNLEPIEDRNIESDIQKSPENSFISTVRSNEQSLVESGIQKLTETSVDSTITSMKVTSPHNFHTESASKVQCSVSDISNQTDPAGSAIIARERDSSFKSSCSLVIPDSVCKSGDLSLVAMEGDDCKKLRWNCSKAGELCLHQNPSHIEALTPSKNQVYDPSKGILKRYPRGCRGPCNCLNCASFHLHAERAFEFSRNQMQDTEDLMLGLMKELSDLQNLLEKSVDGAGCHAFVQVSQVKDACSKASTAQELAKNRIKEMNHELSIHCRAPNLQRPRVRFTQNAGAPMFITANFQANSSKNERE